MLESCPGATRACRPLNTNRSLPAFRCYLSGSPHLNKSEEPLSFNGEKSILTVSLLRLLIYKCKRINSRRRVSDGRGRSEHVPKQNSVICICICLSAPRASGFSFLFGKQKIASNGKSFQQRLAGSTNLFVIPRFAGAFAGAFPNGDDCLNEFLNGTSRCASIGPFWRDFISDADKESAAKWGSEQGAYRL